MLLPARVVSIVLTIFLSSGCAGPEFIPVLSEPQALEVMDVTIPVLEPWREDDLQLEPVAEVQEQEFGIKQTPALNLLIQMALRGIAVAVKAATSAASQAGAAANAALSSATKTVKAAEIALGRARPAGRAVAIKVADLAKASLKEAEEADRLARLAAQARASVQNAQAAAIKAAAGGAKGAMNALKAHSEANYLARLAYDFAKQAHNAASRSAALLKQALKLLKK